MKQAENKKTILNHDINSKEKKENKKKNIRNKKEEKEFRLLKSHLKLRLTREISQNKKAQQIHLLFKKEIPNLT